MAPLAGAAVEMLHRSGSGLHTALVPASITTDQSATRAAADKSCNGLLLLRFLLVLLPCKISTQDRTDTREQTTKRTVPCGGFKGAGGGQGDHAQTTSDHGREMWMEQTRLYRPTGGRHRSSVSHGQARVPSHANTIPVSWLPQPAAGERLLPPYVGKWR